MDLPSAAGNHPGLFIEAYSAAHVRFTLLNTVASSGDPWSFRDVRFASVTNSVMFVLHLPPVCVGLCGRQCVFVCVYV